MKTLLVMSYAILIFTFSVAYAQYENAICSQLQSVTQLQSSVAQLCSGNNNKHLTSTTTGVPGKRGPKGEKGDCYEENYRGITAKLESLQQQLASVKDQPNQTHDNKMIAELKTELTNLKVISSDAISQLQQQNIRFSNELKKSNKMITDQKIELTNHKDELDQSNKMIAELKAELTSLKATSSDAISQLQQQNIRFSNELDQSKKMMAELKAELTSLKAEDQMTEGKISAIEAKDQETEGKISAIEAKDKETEGKISALETKQHQMQLVPRPGDCEELYAGGVTQDGVYTIFPDDSPMQVYCEMSQTQGSIVIQKRYDGSLDYTRSFQEYSDGFGDLTGEHWLGLSLMNRITATGRWKLRVELGSFENEARYAEYSEFKIGPAPGFQLLFDKSSYKGDAGNSLGRHYNMKFTARDKDQDLSRVNNCSIGRGGWWFSNCYMAMTTGMPYSSRYSIRWVAWDVVIKSATLKIKKF